jgi:hypothetical protein
MALPAAPLMSRKRLLGAIVEVTSGTSLLSSVTTPLANTVIYDAKLVPLDLFADGVRRPNWLKLGTLDAIKTSQLGKLTYREELRYGSGFLTMLTGAGFVNDSGYKPTSDFASQKTWSLKLWEDGRWKGIYGASATVKITGAYGKRLFADWEWTGILATPADAALPAATAINTTPWLLKGATFTIGAATAPLVGAFDLDVGNDVQPRPDIKATAGVLQFYVADRSPKLVLGHEAHLVADYDAYGLMLAGTTGALNFVVSDGTHTLTITAPALQRVQIDDGDDQGKALDQTTYSLNADDGDDELVFAVA